MKQLPQLFENNRMWAADITAAQPDFFRKLSSQQAPEYLWIGCSDSRVPANEIVGLLPGEMFVHRNVANVVVHTDLTCLSVLQYAIDVLKVGHVIVCGHYGCGGVKSALDGVKLGLIDNWLRHVQDVANTQTAALDGLEGVARVDRLCELNVVEQGVHVDDLSALPGVLDDGRLADVARLLDHVQLAQPVDAHVPLETVERGVLRVGHVLDVPQPVVDQSELDAVER